MIKNKYLSYVGSIIVFSFFLIFSACKKEENGKNNKITDDILNRVSVINGALHFKSADDFFEISEKLGKLTDEEMKEWENAIHFTSLRTELNMVYRALALSETESSYLTILENNKDIVFEEDDMAKPIIQAYLYTCVANRSGIFYVGENKHELDGAYITSFSTDNTVSNKILYMGEEMQTNRFAGGGYLLDTVMNAGMIEEPDATVPCGSTAHGIYQTATRKLDFHARTYKHTCRSECGLITKNVKFEAKLINYKINVFGKKWVRYVTSCQIFEMRYKVLAPKVTGFNGLSAIFHYETYRGFIGKTPDREAEEYVVSYDIGDIVIGADIMDPTFIGIYGKASNRGIGTAMAVINCGTY